MMPRKKDIRIEWQVGLNIIGWQFNSLIGLYQIFGPISIWIFQIFLITVAPLCGKYDAIVNKYLWEASYGKSRLFSEVKLQNSN